jgi:transcriptional regulator with XRE-family HTH domain
VSDVKYPELGRKIRAARKQAGLSHDRLAAQVGTSRQHLIRLEKGLHAPRPEMVAGIAEATGADPSEFVVDDADEESDLYADLLSHAVREVARSEVRRLLERVAS